jgi:hypothetical protein
MVKSFYRFYWATLKIKYKIAWQNSIVCKNKFHKLSGLQDRKQWKFALTRKEKSTIEKFAFTKLCKFPFNSMEPRDLISILVKMEFYLKLASGITAFLICKLQRFNQYSPIMEKLLNLTWMKVDITLVKVVFLFADISSISCIFTNKLHYYVMNLIFIVFWLNCCKKYYKINTKLAGFEPIYNRLKALFTTHLKIALIYKPPHELSKFQ